MKRLRCACACYWEVDWFLKKFASIWEVLIWLLYEGLMCFWLMFLVVLVFARSTLDLMQLDMV